MTFAEDYLETYPSLRWTMSFDDPDVIALGQARWDTIVSIPGLFEHGNSLWSLQYQKEFTVEFVTDGTTPENDLLIAISTEQGDVVAEGTLLHDLAQKSYSGGDPYYTWETTLQPQNGYVPRLLDTLTVTLEDPATGESLYKRSVRLTWAR